MHITHHLWDTHDHHNTTFGCTNCTHTQKHSRTQFTFQAAAATATALGRAYTRGSSAGAEGGLMRPSNTHTQHPSINANTHAHASGLLLHASRTRTGEKNNAQDGLPGWLWDLRTSAFGQLIRKCRSVLQSAHTHAVCQPTAHVVVLCNVQTRSRGFKSGRHCACRVAGWRIGPHHYRQAYYREGAHGFDARVGT